jgi:hypothetical protein
MKNQKPKFVIDENSVFGVSPTDSSRSPSPDFRYYLFLRDENGIHVESNMNIAPESTRNPDSILDVEYE